MAHGRRRAMWNYTSSVMALLANCHASKGKRFKPDDFNPMAKKVTAKKLSPKDSIDVLLKVFNLGS